MARHDWVGDIARYGLGLKEYWNSVLGLVKFDRKLPGRLFADFAEGSKAEPAAFSVFQQVGWIAYGAMWHINPRYLEASTYDLLFGTSAVNLVEAHNAQDIVGAYDWLNTASHFGGDEANWRRVKAAAYSCLCIAAPRATLESVTVLAGRALRADSNAFDWSDVQMSYLDANGIHATQHVDPTELGQRIEEEFPDYFEFYVDALTVASEL